MKIQNLISSSKKMDNCFITLNTKLLDALIKFNEENKDVIEILSNNGEIVGCVTEHDILLHLQRRGGKGIHDKVEDIELQQAVIFYEDDTVEHALDFMNQSKLQHVSIAHHATNKILGIVSYVSVVAFMASHLAAENKYLLDYISNAPLT